MNESPRTESPRARSRSTRPLRLGMVGALAIAALALAACGSSASKSSSATTTTKAAKAADSSTTAQLKIGSADVAGLGTILVNDKGMTLYILEDAAGMPVACTGDCQKVWPPAELPDGTTAAAAGTGVDQSLLGTTKSDDGDLYVTYKSWPVYTFVKDTTPGQAFGQGLQTFGGTWHVLDTKGNVVTAAASTASATTTTKAASSSGY